MEIMELSVLEEAMDILKAGVGMPKLPSAGGGMSMKPHKYVRKDPDYFGPGKHRYWYKTPSGDLVSSDKEVQEGQELKPEEAQKKPAAMAPEEQKQLGNKIKDLMANVKQKLGGMPAEKTPAPIAATQPQISGAAEDVEFLRNTMPYLDNLAEKLKNTIVQSEAEGLKQEILNNYVGRFRDLVYEKMHKLPPGQTVGKTDTIKTEKDIEKLENMKREAYMNKDMKQAKRIDMRITEISQAEAALEEDKLKQQYASEIKDRTENPQKYYQKNQDVKAKSLSVSNSVKIKEKQAVNDYYLYSINKEQRDAGKSEFKNIDDYYTQVGSAIDSVIKTAAISKYSINAKTGDVKLWGTKEEIEANANKVLELTKNSATNVSYEKIGLEEGKLRGILKFSNLRTVPLYKPYKTSAVDVAQDISSKTLDGNKTARRCMGIGKDGKPILQELTGEKGHNARMVYASKGSGKTEMIEGTIMSALEGNSDGTYRAVVVDPVGATFSILKADDASLSPEQKNYKNKLNNWIKTGRLTVFSDKVDQNNYKDFYKKTTDYINKERALQASSRGSDNNLYNSPYVQGAIDIHMDELQVLNGFAEKDPEMKTKLYSLIRNIANNDSRKNLMPITCYAQMPNTKMNSAIGASWDAIESIGSAAYRAIGSTHGIASAKEFKKAAANEITSYDMNSHTADYYDQMVVGPSIKDAFGEIKGNTEPTNNSNAKEQQIPVSMKEGYTKETMPTGPNVIDAAKVGKKTLPIKRT